VKPFDQVLKDCTAGTKKIQKNEYLSNGIIPIIDQGQKFIAGYTNDKTHQSEVSLPVIIFGDHTRAFKYIDFPFAIGADGVKILKPKNNYDEKFLYYQCLSQYIEDNGYSRHFKFLKKKDFFIPPLPEQKRIAAILEPVFTIHIFCILLRSSII
jgi:type I restriction enzyme S subunit